MARPRKISTDDMINVINSYYETHGNASLLKCSLLAKYAADQGMDIKAYDFRRNPAVRARISELNDFSTFSIDGEPLIYKSLDVDAFINRTRGGESLRTALIELDAAWRRVYDRACLLLKEKESLTKELQQNALNYKKLERDYNELSVQTSQIKSVHKEVYLKNRYLTKAIKEYLYPAIANEILKNEGSLEQVDTDVTASAMASLTDTDIPSSFVEATANDRQTLSREEALLQHMMDGIYRGLNDA